MCQHRNAQFMWVAWMPRELTGSCGACVHLSSSRTVDRGDLATLITATALRPARVFAALSSE